MEGGAKLRDFERMEEGRRVFFFFFFWKKGQERKPFLLNFSMIYF